MKRNYNLFLEKLLELKLNFYATGIKIEFESDYTTSKDNDFFKRLALDSGLDLAIKIGGCGSVRDFHLAERISPQSIIAPMIESSYALEKFYTTAKASCDLNNIDLYFNLETVCGLKNLDEMLKSEYICNFEGIVFGRSDFCGSLKQNDEAVDSNMMLNYVNSTLKKIKNTELEFILGGCISSSSKEFLNRVKGNAFRKFETRKIIFDKKMVDADFESGLKLALELETLWLNGKEFRTTQDNKRLHVLLNRLN